MSHLPTWRKVVRTAAPLALVAIGFVIGVACRDTPAVHADVRRGSAPQAFHSGAQRSERHLADISATLKKIDERLGRLEKLAAQSLASRPKAVEGRR